MTVIFECKHTGKQFRYEDVEYMIPGETIFGLTGYGLHFLDNTYCLITDCNLISARIK